MKTVAWFILGAFSGALNASPRVVSTSPQVTETLFQLGKGSDIKATSHFSDYPEEAKRLPRIGPVFAAGIESILRFEPDWVVTDAEAIPPTLAKALHSAKVSHFTMKVNRVAALFDLSHELLEKIYGERGNTQLARWRKCWKNLLAMPHEGFDFLAFAWLDPPILFGQATFIGDMLTELGGNNLSPPSKVSPFPTVSPEWLLAREPTVVYYLGESSFEQRAKSILEKWWPNRTFRLVRMSPDFFARGSFTPLSHADALLPVSVPKECRP